jgi:hypothetical protein
MCSKFHFRLFVFVYLYPYLIIGSPARRLVRSSPIPSSPICSSALFLVCSLPFILSSPHPLVSSLHFSVVSSSSLSRPCSLHLLLPPSLAPSISCSLHLLLPPSLAPSIPCSLYLVLSPTLAPSISCYLHPLLIFSVPLLFCFFYFSRSRKLYPLLPLIIPSPLSSLLFLPSSLPLVLFNMCCAWWVCCVLYCLCVEYSICCMLVCCMLVCCMLVYPFARLLVSVRALGNL